MVKVVAIPWGAEIVFRLYVDFMKKPRICVGQPWPPPFARQSLSLKEEVRPVHAETKSHRVLYCKRFPDRWLVCPHKLPLGKASTGSASCHGSEQEGRSREKTR